MVWAAVQRESELDLCLEAFISLAGGNLRGCLWGEFQQNIHHFSRCPFRVMVSSDWSVTGHHEHFDMFLNFI